MDQYNQRMHITTKMRPIDVRPDTLESVNTREFSVEDLHQLVKVNITNPATYLVVVLIYGIFVII
ncbi:hypothetical protein NQ315_014001 [Exocentrus adspersus]|uniref:Uncharacterized protein n=1 Tax=Exocentrus adspersus TaxID=1586481 RepID=A0AAV8VHF9_9CUCU|nr:hypothetical protein NQ315_014001 [Exocentrus adspersus]